MSLNDEVVQHRCDCGSLEFHVCYDVRAMGWHVECAKCGAVFSAIKS